MVVGRKSLKEEAKILFRSVSFRVPWRRVAQTKRIPQAKLVVERFRFFRSVCFARAFILQVCTCPNGIHRAASGSFLLLTTTLGVA